MRVFLLSILLTASAFAYFPPKGVPRPVWGTLDPINKPVPAQPGGWPATPVAGYYYVDDRTGTDTANTYGTPNAPRATVPSSPAAGSVIFVAALESSVIAANGWTGTEANPIWVLGADVATVYPDNAQIGMDFTNCDYVIVDGLNVDGSNATPEAGNGQNNKGFRITNGSNFVTLRNLTIKNTVAEGSGYFGDINSVEADTGSTSDVVLYNLDIFDCHGGTSVSYETGGHAIHIVQDPDDVYSATDIWLLDCDIYNIAEDGVQIGQTSQNTTKTNCADIWVADNRIRLCGENAIDLKSCARVFMVENDCWGFLDSFGSDGAAIVLNDEGGGGSPDNAGPENCWVVRNRIHRCAIGVRAATVISTATNYIVGNLIYDTYIPSGEPIPNGATDSASVAIHKRNSSSIQIINNTAFQVGAMLTVQKANDLQLHGNVLYDLNDHTYQRFLFTVNVTSSVYAENYVFDPDGAVAGDNGTTIIEDDPELLAPAAGVFGITSTSPCIGGTEHAAYATYEALTGESIEYDFDERIRDGWDAGAFEYIQPLKDKLGLTLNQKIVVSGDSITDGHKYSHYLIAWLQNTYPALNLKTYELARSGSAIGSWLGFQPGTSSSGLYARYDWLAEPDVLFLMHGQNGVAGDYTTHYQQFYDEWNGVDGTLDTSFGKLVVLTMHPVQSATADKSIESKQATDAALAAAEPNVFHSPTFTWMGEEWMANAANDIDIRQTTAPFFPGTDEVHPGPAGHFVIFLATLMGLEAEKDVSAVAIDADAGTELDSYQATVTGLAATNTSVSFDRLDAALPFAVDEVGRTNATKLYRKAKNWQRYLLRVVNLAAGDYEVAIEGTSIGTWSSEELEAGVNLSDMTNGPVWDRVQETLGEVRDLQNVSRTSGNNITSPSAGTYRYVSFTTTNYQNTTPADLAAYATSMTGKFAEQDDEMAQLQADAEPVALTWTVTALSPPPPIGASATTITVGTLNVTP